MIKFRCVSLQPFDCALHIRDAIFGTHDEGVRVCCRVLCGYYTMSIMHANSVNRRTTHCDLFHVEMNKSNDSRCSCELIRIMSTIFHSIHPDPTSGWNEEKSIQTFVITTDIYGDGGRLSNWLVKRIFRINWSLNSALGQRISFSASLFLNVTQHKPPHPFMNDWRRFTWIVKRKFEDLSIVNVKWTTVNVLLARLPPVPCHAYACFVIYSARVCFMPPSINFRSIHSFKLVFIRFG